MYIGKFMGEVMNIPCISKSIHTVSTFSWCLCKIEQGSQVMTAMKNVRSTKYVPYTVML